MFRLYLIILLSLFSGIYAQAQQVIKIDDLLQKMGQGSDTVMVYNFWATWCRPCVEELPYFEQLREELSGQAVHFQYISLDFRNELNSKLKPFIRKRKFRGEVYLLDEIDYNSWVDRVDPEWGGSIPATIIIIPNKGIKKTFEKPFDYPELKQTITQYLSL